MTTAVFNFNETEADLMGLPRPRRLNVLANAGVIDIGNTRTLPDDILVELGIHRAIHRGQLSHLLSLVKAEYDLWHLQRAEAVAAEELRVRDIPALDADALQRVLLAAVNARKADGKDWRGFCEDIARDARMPGIVKPYDKTPYGVVDAIMGRVRVRRTPALVHLALVDRA